MCGIAGFVSFVPNSPGQQRTTESEIQSAKVLNDMAQSLYSRGPDSAGQWFDEKNQIGFAHRRLSVVDLSSAGEQPMHSSCARFVLIFNGEIYNHLDLRDALANQSHDIQWHGTSDTETLLACFKIWGVEQSLAQIQGMFAFALWDSKHETLTLGRDRFGEKPLYYGRQGSAFIFASQLKALRVHPEFEGKINRDAITLLLRHNYIPAPYSIYQNISKLEPGQLHILDIKTQQAELKYYWSSKGVAEKLQRNRFSGTDEQAIETLEQLLKESVKQQMLADVSLGAFLSGGIDSSTIAALMQAQSSRAIKTFSIGFHQEEYNEATYAKQVAEYLGTDHTELYVSEQQVLDVIPKLADIFDEPFSDSSQIPSYLVAKMAGQKVTVALSGDGADELFCGYNRYAFTEKLWHKLVLLPRVVRKMLSAMICCISIANWYRINKLLPAKYRRLNLGDIMHKGAGVIASRDITQLYKSLVSHWHFPEKVVRQAKEPSTVLNNTLRRPNLTNDVEQMMLLDVLSYLPDDILAKVDRASMGVSLETRVPFLSDKVAEFAWSLPLHYKLRQGVTKWCLKQVLYKYVPKELLDRPKMGFGIPLGDWLRGPLKEWAAALLDEKRLLQEGFFDPKPISRMWQEHQSKTRNWQYHLWDILMFQAWYEKHHK